MKILSMSGFVPTEICDTIRFTGYRGGEKISHYCGYASDFISQIKYDKSIDGAIFPKSCDSSRIIPSYLEGISKFQYQLSIPGRCDDFAVDYYAKQLSDLHDSIERHYKIDLGDIKTRVDLVNERNKLIGDLYSNLSKILYQDYLDSIHAVLQEKLIGNEYRNLTMSCHQKKYFNHRVYLLGSFLCNTNITKIIEENGLGIVGDNLPESGRIENSIVRGDCRNVYTAISKKILNRRLSPTQNNFKHIINCDIKEIKKLEVEGVIYVSQKYCEPYDYLYSIYKKELEKYNIPVLHLSLLDSMDEKKVALSVEAFSDIL